jgi:heparanase 1
VSDKVVSMIEPTYASWNIDSSCNRGFHRTDWSNPNLLAAAKGLAPSKLRFGGSGNDALVYGLSPGSPECAHIKPTTDCAYTTPGCLNASTWEALHKFSEASGSQFIFGVSYGLPQACTEGAKYVWNSTNAASLLNYLAAKKQHLWGFELGNEVNNNGGEPCQQTAAQQAAAMSTFAGMIKEKLPGSVFIGPDTGYKGWQDWLVSYLPLVGEKHMPVALHAVTHHVYPGIGRSSFHSPHALDGTSAEIDWYTKTIQKLAPKSQIWAGEDGPIGGGNSGTCGSNSICSTYASSVWYADDLANRALHGFSQYQRQAFVGGNYGLTASVNEHPQSALGTNEALLLRPDYWLNFMWKRTLGTNIYNATSTDSNVRAYAFSGPPPSSHAAPECKTSQQQLLLINLSPHALATVKFKNQFAYTRWSLSPVANESTLMPDPFSNRASLNEKLLPDLVDIAATNGSSPAFLLDIPVGGIHGSFGDITIELEALSITFLCNHFS